ncbi:hypothetical protein C0992_007211 [Termitomyces sp. T32_za158]|nr:hypothetical protein C0992_007211 [Termitomyces sp. T32_za158]
MVAPAVAGGCAPRVRDRRTAVPTPSAYQGHLLALSRSPMSLSPDIIRRDSPPDPATTPAGLARLLADAYADADALRRELAATKKRVDHADRLIASLQALRDKPDQLDVLKQWEQRALAAEQAKDDADVRRNAIESSWAQLNNYLAQLESVAADARAGFSRVFDGGGPHVVPAVPATRHRGRALLGSFPTLPLPPHPGSRRPRTPSIDSYAHPPPKKSRPDYEPAAPAYTQPRMILPPSSHLLPPQRPRSRSRDSSRSSSSSTSVGDMILQASEGQPNPNGIDPQQMRRKHHVSPPHFPPHYDHARGYPSDYQYDYHRASPKQPGTVIITGAPAEPHPHVQPGQAREFQTHIFAPVVTGAPVKKSKFPQPAVAQAPSTPQGPSQGDSAPAPPPVAAFPPTNDQGQRICRQCGMAGRYKDGKCVEKWGPGPMGPGTVCDRCRKKMKRVERRGTLENQHQQHLATSASLSHLPRPQSQAQSHATIHRADTLPAVSSHLSISALHHPAPQQPNGASRPPRSPGPTIAALREDDDVPRAGSGASRSNSRNGVRATPRPSAHAHSHSHLKHPGALLKRASRSPGSVMDVDADGDADDDADEVDEGLVGAEHRARMEVDAGGDPELDLLEAVDAAEANSSSNSSSNGGGRLKDEE